MPPPSLRRGEGPGPRARILFSHSREFFQRKKITLLFFFFVAIFSRFFRRISAVRLERATDNVDDFSGHKDDLLRNGARASRLSRRRVRPTAERETDRERKGTLTKTKNISRKRISSQIKLCRVPKTHTIEPFLKEKKGSSGQSIASKLFRFLFSIQSFRDALPTTRKKKMQLKIQTKNAP